MSREEMLFMVGLCEKTERFDDMLEFIRRVASLEQDLSADERDMLNLACKEALSGRRRSWRALCNIEKIEEERENRYISLIRDYRDRVEKEISKISEEILILLDGKLISTAATSGNEAHASMLKLKSDLHRYIAEVTVGEPHTRNSEKALQGYNEAIEALKDLQCPAHPAKVSLQLNKCVVLYEIMERDNEAINLAKEVVQSCILEMANLGDEDEKETSILLQLLKDNITLWTTDQELFNDKIKF